MIDDLEDIRGQIQEMGEPELDDNGKPIRRILKMIHRDESVRSVSYVFEPVL